MKAHRSASILTLSSLVFSFSAYAASEKTFDAKRMDKRIEIRIGGNSVVIGDDMDNWSNHALRARIRNLEFAVKALYWKLGMIEDGMIAAPISAPGGAVNCTMELAFNTYSALGPTEAEARHKVMEQCTAKENFSSNCKTDKIKCAR